jgi:N-acetylglucosaminyldiphosphoundecaprenol N-acetyl-beta-D-mannosaminyltransferase
MSKQQLYPKQDILGVEVDALTTAQAIEYIAARPGQPGAAYVVKPYVEFLDRASGDARIKDLLNQADLCLADGVSLAWASYYLQGGRHNLGRLVATLALTALWPRRIYKFIPERIGGINFTLPLLQACSDQELTVFLIGSPKRQAIAQTAAKIKLRFPRLKIIGHFTGELSQELEGELISTLRKQRPDIILVGLGFPRQEQLMSRLVQALDHGVLIGEGGSFDYRELGGRLAKSPGWLQAVHLEWLWRLVIEPSRWQRQLAIPRFIRLVYEAGNKQLTADI